MKPIFIALSPNTQKEDIILALKLLFSPKKWQRGKETKKLEKAFKSYFQSDYAVSFLSARTSLWAILNALGVKENDEILLQAYTCVVVPNAIISLGAKPVWVDINQETFNMDVDDFEKKITEKTKAVVVQYTFGQAAEIKKIIKIAKKYNLFVIEDCAQALGGEYQGKKLGTFGDVGFFSFGRDKIISSVFGGMVITNNKSVGEKLNKIQNNFSFPTKSWIFQQLLHPIIFSIIIPVYSFFNLGKALHFLTYKANFLSRAVAEKEKAGKMPKLLFSKMPNALSALALKQFKRLEEFNEKRIKIAAVYAKELKNPAIELPKIKKDCRHVFLRYAIKTRKPVELISFAQKRKIFLGDWYYPVIAPMGTDLKKVFYWPGACPEAEKASAMSVNLPTHPRMTMEDVKRVVAVVKNFFRQ